MQDPRKRSSCGCIPRRATSRFSSTPSVSSYVSASSSSSFSFKVLILLPLPLPPPPPRINTEAQQNKTSVSQKSRHVQGLSATTARKPSTAATGFVGDSGRSARRWPRFSMRSVLGLGKPPPPKRKNRPCHTHTPPTIHKKHCGTWLWGSMRGSSGNKKTAHLGSNPEECRLHPPPKPPHAQALNKKTITCYKQ